MSASFGPLGPECRGGCSLAAVLDVPRLRPEDFPPARAPGVPVSKLFDPLAPFSLYQNNVLNVRQDNSLDVAVQVVSVEGSTAFPTETNAAGDVQPVVQPGQEAQVGRPTGGSSLPRHPQHASNTHHPPCRSKQKHRTCL